MFDIITNNDFVILRFLAEYRCEHEKIKKKLTGSRCDKMISDFTTKMFYIDTIVSLRVA